MRSALQEIERRKIVCLSGSPPTRSFNKLFRAPLQTSPTIRQMADEYLAEYEKKKAHVGTKRKNGLRAYAEIVVDFFGADMLISLIDEKQCRDFRDLLNRLPSNMRKFYKDREIPLHEIATLAEARALHTLKRNTQDKYIHVLKKIFKWARRHRHIEFNPTKGIESLAPKTPAKTARRSFSENQLGKIFSDELCPYRDSETPSRFWVPLISLFSGMRLNEICQLHIDDVIFDDVPHFRVTPNSSRGQRVKNDHSDRLVPIHPTLITLGFKDFVVISAKKAPNGPLFAELRLSKGGYRSERFSRWFNEQYLPKVGAKESKTSFHSFRHLFKQTLENLNPHHTVIDAICGWHTVLRGSSTIYGDKPPPARLIKYLEQVNFPSVDFSKLLPANHST
jgi:integrase